jgi:hypothetical protein
MENAFDGVGDGADGSEGLDPLGTMLENVPVSLFHSLRRIR